MIIELFTAIELVLGPVGAAKALHLLAPHFFPLWDRKIAQSYGISLTTAGENSAEYLEFMAIVLSQVAPHVRNGTCDGLLKRIDEYNYCRFTKGLIPA